MPLLGPNIPQLQAKRDVAGLVRALQSKDVRTRCDALRALGELREPRAFPILRDCLLAETTTTPEKIQAAEALGQLGDTSAIDALFLASEQNLTLEEREIDAVRMIPDKTYRPEFYVNRIATDEYNLRVAIAHALAQLGGEHAIEKLFQMLAAEDGAMASATQAAIKDAITVALERGNAAYASLVRAQLAHPSATVREHAAHCLRAFPDTESVDALLDVARNEHEVFSVRAAAFVTLGQIGDARALTTLEELLDSSNPNVVREAKQCLFTIRQRLNLPVIRF
ncbi:MAG: HEAT repeat domain-containing protein [Anaerolineae bacterium]|nr:HEAT repeat domain-containing protein [Anaerolineae bacterium]